MKYQEITNGNRIPTHLQMLNDKNNNFNKKKNKTKYDNIIDKIIAVMNKYLRRNILHQHI